MEVLEELYNKYFEKVFEVYDIFKEFFGEEFVDLQNVPSLETLTTEFNDSSCRDENTWFSAYSQRFPSVYDILVYFPSVTVRNEYDKSVVITKLFVKVKVKIDGRLENRFTMNRAEYTAEQFDSGYMHSHIPYIPENKSEFLVPCTGSGPINDTITTLISRFDKDIWNLFCLELSKYVTVESIAGTPYNRLESIGTYGRSYKYNNYIVDSICLPYQGDQLFITSFLSYLIDRQVLKYNHIDGVIGLAMSMQEAALVISNEYIAYINSLEEKPAHQVLYNNIRDYKQRGNDFVGLDNRGSVSHEGAEGNYVCTFKGKPVTLHIIEDTERDTNTIKLLNSQFIDYIITIILRTLNSYYGKETTIKDGSKVIKKRAIL